MKLSETTYDNAETGCCAKLDREKWDDKTVAWKEKPFLKDHIRAFLHMPLNFGSVISRDHALIEQAAAYPEDPMWLTDEVSPWGSDVYVAVDRNELPGATIEKLTGTFVTRVFEGSYRNVGKWMAQMEDELRSGGQEVRKAYLYYATCPKCAKHYGKNSIVLFAQVT